MMDDMTDDGWNEPAVTINGTALTTAQAMTLRVALSSFSLSLHEEDALGDDEHGMAMRRGYQGALRGISSTTRTEGHAAGA